MVAKDQEAKIVKNNVLEMTDLLRYWPMLEIFGGKALGVDYLKANKVKCMYIHFGEIIHTLGFI